MKTEDNLIPGSKIIVALLIVICLFSLSINSYAQTKIERAGLRSSTYGINPFPNSTWWFNASKDMSLRFEGSSPSVIWILGYTTNNGCYVAFPNPNPTITYKNIFFSSSDKNEAYLNSFDSNGVKVWLQIEPGQADIPTLIDLIFKKYGHHKCIVGFGIDAEWYKENERPGWGVPITDLLAQQWEEKVKSFNPELKLFLKHWDRDWMPPNYRGQIVFISDSQGFGSMNDMINEFSSYWANYFKPSKVGFQFGYTNDKTWWSKLSNPPKTIGQEIISKTSNTTDLFWVDFSAYSIWPIGFTTSVNDESSTNLPSQFYLYPNFPNPFNPTTNINFELSKNGIVNLSVFNSLGQKVVTIVNNQLLNSGSHKILLDLSSKPSGLYFLVLQQNGKMQTQKMILIK